ncbi:MAG TPA: efflux RND transporter periplasmic adaptor subunit [Vicinamibacterales bacterium]|jgi:multidrug efflux system membrane fusion protein|nr:efflux RND transporter periplasmic adaptor subunit [Vicinamibacterales bacterium]
MKTGLVQLVPLLTVSLAAGGCKAPPAYEQPVTPVTVGRAAASATGTTVRYSATVRPSVEVPVAFKVAGYVDDILTRPDDRGRVRDVQEGDRVEKGDALARVRQSDYQQSVDQITAGVAEATAAYDHAKLEYDRASRLFAKQSLTKPELDGAKARLDATAAKVEGAKAGLGEAQLVLGDAVLRAPLAGVVLKRSIERGSLVSPGVPAFVLADTSSVKVVFGVPDVVVKQLKIGRAQRLAFEALKDEPFEGHITSIAPAPDPVSRVYQIEITVPNAQHKLEVGFIASLQLADQPGETVVTVPLEAIVKPATGSAEYGVFVLDGDGDAQVAKLRAVKLGGVVGNAITVTGGLSVGQQIIVRGATLLTDGQRVRALP